MFKTRTILLLASLLAFAGCSDKTPKSICSIDAVNNSAESIVTMKNKGTLIVAGWAADNISKLAPDSVTINLVSSAGVVSKIVDGKTTVARPDVKQAINAPTTVNFGFGLSAQLEPLAPGIYEIQLLQHFPDSVLVCKTPKSIKID